MKKPQRTQKDREGAEHVAATGAQGGSSPSFPERLAAAAAASVSARRAAGDHPPRSAAGGAPKAGRASAAAGVAEIFRSETAKVAFAGCSPVGGAGAGHGRGATGRGPSNADIVALTSRAWERRHQAEARTAGPDPANGLGVRAILAARGKVHGEFATQAAFGQALKSTLRASANWSTLTDVQVDGLEAICVKLARILAGDPNWPDHWVDIAGYATLVSERLGPPRSFEPGRVPDDAPAADAAEFDGD